MPAEFKFDGLLKDSFSEPTRKVLTLFPEMLVSQEGILGTSRQQEAGMRRGSPAAHQC
jgi:hypothetical protein